MLTIRLLQGEILYEWSCHTIFITYGICLGWIFILLIMVLTLFVCWNFKKEKLLSWFFIKHWSCYIFVSRLFSLFLFSFSVIAFNMMKSLARRCCSRLKLWSKSYIVQEIHEQVKLHIVSYNSSNSMKIKVQQQDWTTSSRILHFRQSRIIMITLLNANT